MNAGVPVVFGCLVLGLVLRGGLWRPLEDRWANLAKQVEDDDTSGARWLREQPHVQRRWRLVFGHVLVWSSLASFVVFAIVT